MNAIRLAAYQLISRLVYDINLTRLSLYNSASRQAGELVSFSRQQVVSGETACCSALALLSVVVAAVVVVRIN